MDIPEYVTKAEVRRVCELLGIRDWSAPSASKVDPREAQIIRDSVGGETLQIPLEAFVRGLEVELEHGVAFPDSNVTNNHPLLTGRIVLAHLKETLDYYNRLEVAELEGDMLKALVTGDPSKLAKKYANLVQARSVLSSLERARVGSE